MFASSLDWPGWCRRGRSEKLALTALVRAAWEIFGLTEPAG